MSSAKRKASSTTDSNKVKKTRKTVKENQTQKIKTKKQVKQDTKNTKKKRVPKKKKSNVSRYQQYKDFLIANKYCLRAIKEFELALACTVLQRRNMELQIRLDQDIDTDLIIID